jgi:hypothetical protein
LKYFLYGGSWQMCPNFLCYYCGNHQPLEE